jgi:hypothetical protein
MAGLINVGEYQRTLQNKKRTWTQVFAKGIVQSDNNYRRLFGFITSAHHWLVGWTYKPKPFPTRYLVRCQCFIANKQELLNCNKCLSPLTTAPGNRYSLCDTFCLLIYKISSIFPWYSGLLQHKTFSIEWGYTKQ